MIKILYLEVEQELKQKLRIAAAQHDDMKLNKFCIKVLESAVKDITVKQ